MRTYKRKTERGKIPTYIYEKVATILEEDKSKKLRTVAREFGLSPVTLVRYIRKRKEAKDKGIPVESLTVGYRKNKVFDDEHEAILVSYFMECSQIYYGLTSKDIRRLAYDCALTYNLLMPSTWQNNREAGSEWQMAFLKRNRSLPIRPPEVNSINTKLVQTDVDHFFHKLAEVMEQYKFTSSRIWNIDEIRVATVQKPIKKSTSEKQGGSVTSKEQGSFVTVSVAANALGYTVPCMFIFPGIKYSTDDLNCDGPPHSICVGNTSGSMTGVEFKIFMQHFIDNVRPSPSDPVLLLLDNHVSHLDFGVIQMAKENNVILLSFPPNCSHKFQPLEVGVHRPFKFYCAGQQNSWLRNNPSKKMTIYDIPTIVSQVLPLALNPVNIIKGFRKAGIEPFNKNVLF